MRNMFIVISLGLCVLAAGCQKKLTKEEADLMKDLSRQNHETMMVAMATMEQSKQRDSYHINSGGSTSSGWAIMEGSLGQVHTAVLEVLEEADITMSSEAVDGVSGEVDAKLATNNKLLFCLAAVDKNSAKVLITIFGGDYRVSNTQIEYLFEQVINNVPEVVGN